MKTPLYNRWAVLAVVGVIVLTGLQIWSAQDTQKRTTHLHSLLSDTQTQAMQIMNELGYGGLIHSFKNLILRPEDPQYRVRTLESADAATLLAEKLERNAAELGMEATLDNTRNMIDVYRTHVDRVLQMHDEKLPIAEIDNAVRFNDEIALLEINNLVSNLSFAVTRRLNEVTTRGAQFFMSTIIGTVLISGIAIGLLFNQQQKRKHLLLMSKLNNKLELSNSDLQTANRSLQQFAGIVSHDLKAPLRHIRQFNEFVLDDYADRARVEEHVGKIRHSSERMDNLIASLLEFTRAGFSNPALVDVSVTELVHRVVSDLQLTIEATSAMLTLDLNGDMRADPELLERVLHNLIGNSLKYTKPDIPPKIDITAKPVGDKIRITITDNGIGIDPQYGERIFRPLQRLHNSESQFEGSGIGLFLVKSVVEAHDGHVWLDTAYTEGSRLEFEIKASNKARD
ncbi:MAG: ATP-binding protein [Granulosicoccus sp.]